MTTPTTPQERGRLQRLAIQRMAARMKRARERMRKRGKNGR